MARNEEHVVWTVFQHMCWCFGLFATSATEGTNILRRHTGISRYASQRRVVYLEVSFNALVHSEPERSCLSYKKNYFPSGTLKMAYSDSLPFALGPFFEGPIPKCPPYFLYTVIHTFRI
uniref:Uncharacterized protein n=1 Tax=Panstrongylus lignarius TaxID=156445 RepID=A0A224Y1D9_9HEMI